MKIKTKILENSFTTELDRSLSNKYKINLEFKHLYIDLDDCIIIENKLNADMIRFIINCINKKIKIHLLTKHRKNLDKTLGKFKISELFDSKIQIEKNDKKYLYIKHKNSIFVDDSFSERLEIKEKLKIPVFGLESIEIFN